MTSHRSSTAAIIGLAAMLAGPASAQWSFDADTMYWRTDCTGMDPTTCVDSPEQDLSFHFFIPSARKPSAAKPLLIDIGPGTFNSDAYYASFFCVHFPAIGWQASHITLRGSGPGITVIGDDDDDLYAMELDNCSDLHFQDMTVIGPIGIYWNGGGSSTWENVEIIGDTKGWNDASCNPGGLWPFTGQPVHYFFSSVVRAIGGGNATSAVGFNAPCSENWFYGGEISALGDENSSSALQSATGVSVGTMSGFKGNVRVFGSAIRTGSGGLPASHPAFSAGTGVSVSGGGAFHMHGGIINTTTSGIAGADATGLKVAGTGSFGHTPGTAFIVKPGSGGTGTRVVEAGGGVAQSPFLWQAGTAPPVPALASVEGADMYVEYDCGADGDCDGGGSQAHIMVYNQAECPSETWFDTTTGRCRNVTAP